MAHRDPPDVNEMAFRIVKAAMAEDAAEERELPQVTAVRQGGKARAEVLSPERRSACQAWELIYGSAQAVA